MGSVVLAGATSGSTTITPSATGTYTITLPAETGTIQTSGSGFTTNGVAYASSTSALTTGSVLQFTSNGLGIGAAPNTSPGSPYYMLNVGTQGGAGIIGAGTDVYFTNNVYITGGNNYYAYSGSAYASYYNQTGGVHSWRTSSAAGTGGNVATLNEFMRLDTSGNLLVGTTTLSYNEKFAVNQASSTSGNYAGFFNNQNGSTNNGIRITIGSAGNNTSTWHFNGTTAGSASYYLYGNGTSSYSSDERLKKNIQSTRNGYLEDLCKLRVVKYQWLGDDENCQQTELGLIAQEVEAVFPKLVQEHEIEGVGIRKNIKQSVLPFMMLKAIQELSTLITAQQSTIQSLTERITALEGART